jgi:hypothetical protein
MSDNPFSALLPDYPWMNEADRAQAIERYHEMAEMQWPDPLTKLRAIASLFESAQPDAPLLDEGD